MLENGSLVANYSDFLPRMVQSRGSGCGWAETGRAEATNSDMNANANATGTGNIPGQIKKERKKGKKGKQRRVGDEYLPNVTR
jgi:hypothetical protein